MNLVKQTRGNTMQDLQKELQRVIELNKLMNREVGNRDHLFLQAQLLVQEGITELSEAAYQQDRIKLRDALANTVVVAMGGDYIASGAHFPSVRKPKDEDIGAIFQSASRCVEHVLTIDDDLFISLSFMAVIDYVMGYTEAEGIDLAADLKAVNDSNLSKFCQTNQEVVETIQKYEKLGLPAEYRETGNDDYPFAVYSMETVGDFTKGKLLKSVDYQGPVFL